MSNSESKILIVDDERGIRDLLTDILNLMGYETFAARDGNQAIDRLDEHEYDLIICDMKMPGLNGESLYNLIKATKPELADRIIFMTGDTVNAQTHGFLESTGNLYVNKPFRIEEIRQCIRKSLAREPV